MKGPVLALSFLLLMVLSGTVLALSWSPATVEPDAEDVIRAAVQAEHRRACGDDDFSHDRPLRWAARYKAMDMGYRDTMSHALADDARVFDFYTTAGIDKSHGAGEIIAFNNFPNDESAEVAFRGWMNSQPHREAIQNCDYDRFGVGAFKTADPDTPLTSKWYAVEFTNISAP